MEGLRTPRIARYNYIAFDYMFEGYSVTHPNGTLLAVCDSRKEAIAYVKQYMAGPYAHTLGCE